MYVAANLRSVGGALCEGETFEYRGLRGWRLQAPEPETARLHFPYFTTTPHQDERHICISSSTDFGNCRSSVPPGVCFKAWLLFLITTPDRHARVGCTGIDESLRAALNKMPGYALGSCYKGAATQGNTAQSNCPSQLLFRHPFRISWDN